MRKIGNHLDLKYLSNIDIKNLENSRVKISLVFTINNDVDNYKSKIKEYYFDIQEAHAFFNYLKYFFKILKIPLILNNKIIDKN